MTIMVIQIAANTHIEIFSRVRHLGLQVWSIGHNLVGGRLTHTVGGGGGERQ